MPISEGINERYRLFETVTPVTTILPRPAIQSRHWAMKYRREFLLVLTLASVFCLVKGFMPEILALGWHVRHGSTLQMKTLEGKKYSIDAPILFWPQADESGWDVALIKHPGPLRASFGQADWAIVSLSVARQHSTGEELRNRASALNTNAGLVLTEVASVKVAGQDLYCFDQRWEKGKNSELQVKAPAVELMCVPLSDKHSLSASYIGTRALLPVFYDVLHSVKCAN
jgi:hypothetical protein